jgi:hypothetical protein
MRTRSVTLVAARRIQVDRELSTGHVGERLWRWRGCLGHFISTTSCLLPVDLQTSEGVYSWGSTLSKVFFVFLWPIRHVRTRQLCHHHGSLGTGWAVQGSLPPPKHRCDSLWSSLDSILSCGFATALAGTYSWLLRKNSLNALLGGLFRIPKSDN